MTHFLVRGILINWQFVLIGNQLITSPYCHMQVTDYYTSQCKIMYKSCAVPEICLGPGFGLVERILVWCQFCSNYIMYCLKLVSSYSQNK